MQQFLQFIILTFIYSSTCLRASWSCQLWPDHDQQHCYHHTPKVKAEAATADVELLMMGVRTPETCWAANKRQNNKPERLLHLVGWFIWILWWSMDFQILNLHVMPSLSQQNCCIREVLFLQMLAKFLSQHTSGLSRKRCNFRSGLKVSYARKLKSSRKSLAGWWQSILAAAVEACLQFQCKTRKYTALHPAYLNCQRSAVY
jgi:hypothetical protein